ncbi:MAG: hypothetical protein JWQ43_593 [Glaciihabitans sp.]|nr:hypothetical protein [Glaciihabitans sp.]
MAQRYGDAAAGIGGGVLVLLALALIWISRLSMSRDVYVSEMGATGEPTARLFQIALLLVVAGGSLIAFASRTIHTRVRVLRLWTPAISLWLACGFFLVASQATCTPGCPVPFSERFTLQDFVHIFCAVLAFAAACWAMLQVSFARHQRRLILLSRTCCAAVALIAGAGGILSLINVATVFGSRLEFVATTIAIGWVAAYGAVIGAGHLAPAAPRRKENIPQPMASAPSA